MADLVDLCPGKTAHLHRSVAVSQAERLADRRVSCDLRLRDRGGRRCRDDVNERLDGGRSLGGPARIAQFPGPDGDSLAGRGIG